MSYLQNAYSTEMINKCYYGNDIHVAWACINVLYTSLKKCQG